ncbi:GDYXXLXY domain-containing protein [Ochrobactrum teleogrylli]|uniref:GDYXXLXY domain-containing protein n=1 Tax=Ochrobactrum teleogrylli TaxID=2479765 RepID=A0ABY2Y3L7_9HYPH|nr:GDYXXLXY domain-containing protein [[Ochrobactrum] teleogrylli]TNV15047.1 hypothetical protein FIC94_12910 [[Ochrobactrum] teleogrylli]
MSKKWLYIGAAVSALLQSGILYAGIEQRASILRSGHEIVLQTEPVDPRDLMRGDYVILGYAISSVMGKDVQGKPTGEPRTVYVALKPDAEKLWHFSRAALSPFTDLAPDEVQIRGQSTYPVSGYPDQTIRLNFGIERYYVPEGQGRDIEIGQRESRISVVVAVDDSGTAVIKALRDEGRQLYEEPLY